MDAAIATTMTHATTLVCDMGTYPRIPVGGIIARQRSFFLLLAEAPGYHDAHRFHVTRTGGCMSPIRRTIVLAMAVGISATLRCPPGQAGGEKVPPWKPFLAA